MLSQLMTILFVMSFSIFSLATETPETPKESNVRAGRSLAVSEANAKDGFQLKEKAQKNIGVIRQAVGSPPYTLPSSCLIYFGDKIGVYRIRNGWFKLITISIDKKSNGSVSFSSNELQANDEVAVQGGALLRVTEMDAFGGEE